MTKGLFKKALVEIVSAAILALSVSGCGYSSGYTYQPRNYYNPYANPTSRYRAPKVHFPRNVGIPPNVNRYRTPNPIFPRTPIVPPPTPNFPRLPPQNFPRW